MKERGESRLADTRGFSKFIRSPFLHRELQVVNF
jgi:hypothetical protein